MKNLKKKTPTVTPKKGEAPAKRGKTGIKIKNKDKSFKLPWSKSFPWALSMFC